MIYGVDVSHHQNPTALPWADMRAAGCSFCIVRLTYGTMLDRHAAEHVKRARAVGMRVGAYHFFRASLPVASQLDAFDRACFSSGYGEPGDIVPALDFEDDTEKRPILPEHAPLAERAYRGLELRFEAEPLIYTTQRDWGRVGRPDWVLRAPLWVAHYSAPSRKEPATPGGMAWAIWQHRVGRFVFDGPAGYYKDDAPQIDQNRALALPLINGETLRETATENAAPEERTVAESGEDHDARALALLQARLLDGLDLSDGR
jgi:lysozyme